MSYEAKTKLLLKKNVSFCLGLDQLFIKIIMILNVGKLITYFYNLKKFNDAICHVNTVQLQLEEYFISICER